MTAAAEGYREQIREAVRIVRRCELADPQPVTSTLYDRWYAPASADPVMSPGPEQMVAFLRASHASSARFEPGWVVIDPRHATQRIGTQTSHWQIAALREHELRWLDPIDIIYGGGLGLRPKPGATIEATQRRDSMDLLPGWWTSVSPVWDKVTRPILRIYWAVKPDRLLHLVRHLTIALDPAFPYALKCPLELSRCQRPDGVVLYLAASDWSMMRPEIGAVHETVQSTLRDQTPALTLALGHGIALAEDPGDTSFGDHRCQIIAEALAAAGNDLDEDQLVELVVASFESRKLRIDAPYLNPGSNAEYAL